MNLVQGGDENGKQSVEIKINAKKNKEEEDKVQRRCLEKAKRGK